MMLTPRERRLLYLGIAAMLMLVVSSAAFLAQEPLRRSMEGEINRRLTGYTVRLRTLEVHPWTFSLELRDATIFQNANPDPPVVHIPSLIASLHWRALLHGKVVANVTFDRPVVHFNLRHVDVEAESTIALKDRGWQRALEAVALDLKIDRLQVLNGDLTYVDEGPFRPLHVSRLNANADNIRNIRSKDRVYPSNVHVEGVVFDVGTVWLDGHADFLAEPHVGFQAALRLEQIELDYFKPITNRYNVSVRDGTLSLVGTVEVASTINTVTLDRVTVHGARVEYVHTARTATTEAARAQRTVRAAKEVANDPATQLRINRLDIVKSRFGFVNRAAPRAYRITLTDADLTVENLSNQRVDGTAVVRLRGRFMGSGQTWAEASFRPETGSADMRLKLRIEHADMVSMNDLVRAYGGFDVGAGALFVYSELALRGGAISGYVKPLFRGVRIPDEREDVPKGFGQRLYERLVGLVAKILKSGSRGEIATVVEVSGRVDRPETSTWQVVGRLLQNAFVRAILPGFERAPDGERPSARPR